jgi:hypothetical protein
LHPGNAARRWFARRLQPNHDRVADPIETVISAPRLGMLSNNPRGFQNMTSFSDRHAGPQFGLKYPQRLRGIAYA